jgi:hypothetical protein
MRFWILTAAGIQVMVFKNDTLYVATNLKEKSTHAIFRVENTFSRFHQKLGHGVIS